MVSFDWMFQSWLVGNGLELLALQDALQESGRVPFVTDLQFATGAKLDLMVKQRDSCSNPAVDFDQ